MIVKPNFTLATLLGLSVAAAPFTKYVSKGGSDSTGNGSFVKPYLTIQAAVTAIGNTGTSAQPWAICLGPGVYSSAFALDPWEFVIGAGRNATVIANPSANWLSANWIAAGTQDGGFVQCQFATNNIVVNFNAVASPGAGRFFLYDSNLSGVIWTVTGNNVSNEFTAENIQQLTSVAGPCTITNCNFRKLSMLDLFDTGLTISNTGLTFNIAGRIHGLFTSRNLTLVCNTTASTMLQCVLDGWQTISAPLVLTGDGMSIIGRGFIFVQTGGDADTAVYALPSAGAITTPALHLVDEGINVIQVTPTANRIYNFIDSANPTTRVRIHNASSAFFITLTFPTGIQPAQTYIPPGGVFDAVKFAGGVYQFLPFTQEGSVAYVNGVSAFIPADVTANSTIDATLSNLNGSVAIGLPVVLDADRVVGSRAGGGGFIVRSLTLAGVAVAADQSSFRWTCTY
jgi:hypothetical protein